MFTQKIFCGQKIFLPGKYFCLKNTFAQKIFSSAKIFLAKKIFLSERFVGETTNKFGPKVLKLQPKAAFNSPPQELEEGARSAPYLLVLQIVL
jgi:hypothetical protein